MPVAHLLGSRTALRCDTGRVHVVSILLVALMIPVGGQFGEGSASATDHGNGLITLTMTVDGPEGVAVVAHVIDPGDNQETFTLVGDGSGTYTGQAEVEQANLVVVFEVLFANGTSSLSDPATLLELGVDPIVLGYVTEDSIPVEESRPIVSDENRQLLWIAVAAVASALALLAVWAAGPSQKRQSEQTNEEEE